MSRDAKIVFGFIVFFVVLLFALYALGMWPFVKKAIPLNPPVPKPVDTTPDTSTTPDTQTESSSGPSNPTREVPPPPTGVALITAATTTRAGNPITTMSPVRSDGFVDLTSSNEGEKVYENATLYGTGTCSIIVPRNAIFKSVSFVIQQVGDVPITMRNFTMHYNGSDIPYMTALTLTPPPKVYKEYIVTLDDINANRMDRWAGSLRTGMVFTFDLDAGSDSTSYNVRANADNTIVTYLTVSTLLSKVTTSSTTSTTQ
jgi:hypothetical protein